jgi:TfoX/Sxy family transcriptional regulator of competence genes
MAKKERDEEALSDRRARRAAGQDVFDKLAAGFEERDGVSRGPMFGSMGLLSGGKFFAFVGRAGDLVLKLPEAQVTALVDAGEASAVRAGRNATREWVSVPLGRQGEQRWRELMEDAYRFAASGRGGVS